MFIRKLTVSQVFTSSYEMHRNAHIVKYTDSPLVSKLLLYLHKCDWYYEAA